MKYTIIFILLVPSIVFPFDTGIDLKEICGKGQVAGSDLACKVYIKGVIEGVSLGAKVTSFDITGEFVDYEFFCLPDGGTIDQYVAIVKKYIEGHPGIIHEPSPSLISLAIEEAFPCN